MSVNLHLSEVRFTLTLETTLEANAYLSNTALKKV